MKELKQRVVEWMEGIALASLILGALVIGGIVLLVSYVAALIGFVISLLVTGWWLLLRPWASPRTRDDDTEDVEYMECPNCKEVLLPVEGGECLDCHKETRF